MRELKRVLFTLTRECIEGEHQGWCGGAGAPSLDEVEYLSEQWYVRAGSLLAFAHLDDVEDLGEHVRARAELINVLASRKISSAESAERAIEILTAEYTVLSGTADEVARRHGVERGLVDELDPTILQGVALRILHDHDKIHYLLRLTVLFTESYRRFRLEDLDSIECDDEQIKSLAVRVHQGWARRFKGPSMVALPHGPMSTLTRETANLGELVREGEAGWRMAGAKYHEGEDSRQLALVFDRSLVVKDNDVDDTYMQLPLEGPLDEGLDAIGALTRVLMEHHHQVTRKATSQARLANLVEDIPRVVAGMFQVASMDRNLTFLNEGNFIDSLSGIRLAEYIGLDASQKRCRDRVAAVRGMLESIELSRSVRGENGKSVTWTGPIIQRLKDKVDASEKLPDGLNRAVTDLGVWRIAPELWRMQVPEKGKAASFMLLDDRAFSLSSRDSVPFNLYWTIIQRAYNTRKARKDEDRFDQTGTFHPRFETLYRWAGMETKTDETKPHRAVNRMRDALELLVEHGLIEAYSSSVFELKRFSLKNDTRRRVSITLPHSLLGHLTDNSFTSGENRFATRQLAQ
jgi:hypothetical protein